MKITSILKSVQSFLPKLISRFSSIIKNYQFMDPGKSEPIILKDSKDIATARKNVKEAFYIYIDTQYGQLQAIDIKFVIDNKKNIVITPAQFETLISRSFTEIRPAFETFLSEKKMSLSMSKYLSIVISGLLIEILNEND